MNKFFAEWNAPRWLLGVACGLVLLSILLAGVASRTDLGATRLPTPEASRTVDLRFEDRADGAIVVWDISVAHIAHVLTPGSDGFVRVALRSLARDRRISGIGSEAPFRLGLQQDGRLWLLDPSTRRVLYLDAYGQGNARSFAQFLEPGRVSR